MLRIPMDTLKSPILRCGIYCTIAFLTVIQDAGVHGNFTYWTLISGLIAAGVNYFAFLSDSNVVMPSQTVTATVEKGQDIQVDVTPPSHTKHEGE
jgi:hypothetical protein